MRPASRNPEQRAWNRRRALDRCLLQLLCQVRLDLVVLGESPFLHLAVDKVTIDGDLESASIRRNQDEGFDVDLELFQQLFRQTGGSFLVASLGAVFEFELHGVSPSWVGLNSAAACAA